MKTKREREKDREGVGGRMGEKVEEGGRERGAGRRKGEEAVSEWGGKGKQRRRRSEGGGGGDGGGG